MIEAEAALIVIVDANLGRFVNLVGSVGERIELLGLESDRADQVRRNHVVRELLSGELIDQWRLAGEIAAVFGFGRYDAALCHAIGEALALVVEEEEVFVL